MNRETILKLADQLPTGRQDPRAVSKFRAEQREFADEIAAGKRIDAATELADLVYYYCKMNMLAAQAGIGRGQVVRQLIEEKMYSLSPDDSPAPLKTTVKGDA